MAPIGTAGVATRPARPSRGGLTVRRRGAGTSRQEPTMMTLPPDDEKIVRDWIAKHWKGCPFCGDAQPGWHVQGECNLPFTYSGLPSGTRTVAGIALIPVV